jgi:hypothetical protein
MMWAMARLYMLFALADLAMLVIALIDCLATDGHEIRALPKVVWVFVILLFSPLGGITWFVAGRPQHAAAGARREMGRPGAGFPGASRPRQVAPDDDPEFLRNLARTSRADEEMLRNWEADLRRREEEMKRRKADDADG